MVKLHLDENGIYVSDLAEKAKISYPDHGNNECFAIEKNSFWFNYRNEVIREAILKYPTPGNFADIGGGNGYQADYISKNFPEKKVFLIEPGYEGCLNARKYGVENVYNIPFQDFDFTANNISGIGLFDVIEHIEDDVSFLREISHHAQKGTHIYITVPAYNWLWSDTDDYAGHYRRYTSKMLNSLAKKANLKVLHNGYFMFYLTIPVFFARSLPYKIRGKRDEKLLLDESSENHIVGPVASAILTLLNKIDLGTIHNFGRMFIGGSCLAVLQT